MLSDFSFHRWVRSLRGWGYRLIPPIRDEWNRKRIAGYERRWNLEVEGFTKEGFFRILQRNILAKVRAGDFYELVAGDGQVGSLGIWLERGGGDGGWKHGNIAPIRWRLSGVIAREPKFMEIG